MSFGYSVGDLITTIRLASELRKRFVDAPSQYQAIRDDVKTVSVLLVDIEDILPHRDLSKEREQQLCTLGSNCEQVLSDINQELAKCPGLQGGLRDKRDSLHDAWRRLRWNQKDIDTFRDRLVLNVSGLGAFIQRLNNDTTLEIQDGVNRLNLSQDAREQQTQRQAILDWLSKKDHVSVQTDVLQTRQEGTGVWLLRSKEFKTWLDEPGRTILCTGIPGAGKTVMAGAIIDHLQRSFRNDSTVGIAYFYFNYLNHQEQVHEAVVCSLLRQLLNNMESLPEKIIDLYTEHEKYSNRPTRTELEVAFEEVADMHSRIFIVLDALDENFSTNPVALKGILSLLNPSERRPPVSLVCTSRNVSDIVSQFSHSTSMTIYAHEEDMEAYISARMDELLRGKIGRHPELQVAVKTQVLEATKGMFLLAKLHLDSLRGQPRVADLKKALKDLPKGADGLDRTYDQAMERIHAQTQSSRVLARSILMWIVHGKRALSVDEIIEALAIEPGASGLDEELFLDPEDLDSLCAGLVTIDHNTQTVRLVHYTAQTYFEQKKLFPQAHQIIAEACTTYLSFDRFSKGYKSTIDTTSHFFDYARASWIHHVRSCTDISDQVIHHLKNSAKFLHACLWDHRSDKELTLYYLEPQDILGVHVAARYDLPAIMERLIDLGQIPDIEDAMGMTPLMHAAAHRASGTLEILLKNYNADPNHWNRTGHTALKLAIQNFDHECIDILLADPRTDPNFVPYFDGSSQEYKNFEVEIERDISYNLEARGYNSMRGEAAFRDLFQDRKDFRIRDHSINPLSRAVSQGHVGVVKSLLACPRTIVNTEVENMPDHDCFSVAIDWHSVDVVGVIATDHRFRLNLRITTRQRFVKLATDLGLEDLMFSLIGKFEVDILEKTDGHSILSCAVLAQDFGLVKRLLGDPITNARIRDAEHIDNTPLYLAVTYDLKDIAFQLLLHGYNPTPSGCETLTPLHEAAWRNRAEIAELMLQHGANMNARSTGNQTPLSMAVKHHSVQVVELLLERGAAVDEQAVQAATSHHPSLWHKESAERERARRIRKLILGDGADEAR